MRISDVPWLVAAIALVIVGGAVTWLSLVQLAAGNSGAAGLGLYLIGIVGGLTVLVCGLLGLGLYVTRRRR